MAARTNPLPLVGVAPMAAMPAMLSPEMAASGALYAMSDNVYDTSYTVSTTYSETNHRATFANSASVTSVARLLTGYGVSGQVRAIEFAPVVQGGGSLLVGLRPSLTQGTTGTGLDSGTNDVAYHSSLGVYVNAVQVATPGTWGAGDKIGFIYTPAAGTVGFYLNGAIVYTATGISGNYTPAAQGANNNTNSIRVSTSWSYGAIPGGALYWR